MNNLNIDIDKYLLGDSKSLKDYILLIRTNLIPFFIISLAITVAAIIYAVRAEDIYKSTVTMKITKQQQGVLESSPLPVIGGLVNDRFIENEIEVMNNYDTRERYAIALIDSFNNSKEKNLFKVLKSEDGKGINGHKSLQTIAELLEDIVSVEQINGIDIVEISAESPNPYEAALIANTCANQYKQINLEGNRNLVTTIRMFLEKKSKEKLSELNNAEDSLKSFQERGGIVALDVQSIALINQLAQLDAQRDAVRIDLMTSNEVLNSYKNTVKKQDPQLAEYLESQTSQAYIDVLQKQIAELQMNRDLAMANKNPNIDVSAKMKDYDKKITELKEKLSALIKDIKAGAFASSPDQIKDLTQKLIEEEINNRSLSIKLKELQVIISKYEQNFNRLPKKSIELARYQRKRESLQRLYLLVEQKYQEAMINELSQPGNAAIIGIGRVPDKPAKPNRILIALIGLFAGLGAAFGYVLIKDYFDDTVKTPEDIQKKNINILAWVPHFKNIGKNGSAKQAFIVAEKPDSSSSEAFRALRARIQFSRVDSNSPKTILITSPAELEGKTVVSINLARSFAQSNKKTLLIDCDLRRPRIHSIMKVQRIPGLVDYLFNTAKLERIIRSSSMNNLNYITTGTIPPDPAEVLESKAMKNFLEEMKNGFDIVIIDSAPIVAVIDSEILSRLADGTILVVSADLTEMELMLDAVDLMKKDNVPFLGTVLNNFKYKKGHSYYFKYYYNYSSYGKGDRKHKVKS
ncbi:MAG: polysaccharide biosynthesis tyrosine autokinase [Bacteroidetes bacterium]|nr:polysaccharide biosynthesis tyrosine autokinase [Bacteroidota bacterium]